MSDEESTARFLNEDPKAPIRYVDMCKQCRGFLPETVRIITRNDFEEEDLSEFDLEGVDDDQEEE